MHAYTKTKTGSNNLAYVNAARGIAILLVVLVHTAQSVSGLDGSLARVVALGQMGVQLFFVASAFTLCLAHAQRQGEPRPLLSFFIRRFFRIAPLYYLGILIYFVVFLTRPDVGPNPFSSKNVAANLFFVHGFIPSANNTIVPGGWSIGTEMAFYVCFPLLFTLFEKLKGMGTWTLAACIGVTLAADLLAVRVLRPAFDMGMMNNSFLYYNLINQLPVFMLGMLAYFLLKDGRVPPLLDSKAALAATVAVPVALGFALWGYKPHVMFVFMPTLFGIAFFALLFLLRQWRQPSELLCSIGRVSFSIYIFHFIFAKVLLKPLLAQLPSSIPPSLVLAASYVVVCAITYRIAVETEKQIEKRGIAFGSELIRRFNLRAAAV